jgi:glycerol-3-phosphate dehydrogenase subunit C
MREGSLDAPTRHPIAWQDDSFYDPQEVEKELRRVFDICHGCRRCFNLCDSFPRLFDTIDESRTGELDAVDSKDFKPVIDACTLCDMCFMTKCPYVPPHEFNLDFPHLMLRYRAMEARQGKLSLADRQLANTDRNGRLASLIAGAANWATDRFNKPARALLHRQAKIHPEAALPRYRSKTFQQRAKAVPEINTKAPAFGRKAVLYATCFVNFNEPEVGSATQAVLARNGVETTVVYPHCCGMPLLEQGRLGDVAQSARQVASAMQDWIDKGYDVIALVPSCALMLKFEWPLILPDDPQVKALSKATYDISEYIVDIARKEGLADGLQPLAGGVTLHMACHARAQNMGQKAAEMLRLLPEADVAVIERCSGHGGSWGFKDPHFETAIKVGRPTARQVRGSAKAFVTSECPLAGTHIAQGMEKLGGEGEQPQLVTHPIQLFAQAYGIGPHGEPRNAEQT